MFPQREMSVGGVHVDLSGVNVDHNMDEIRKCVKEAMATYGLVMIKGFDNGEQDFCPASSMEELMLAFGPKEEMSDYSNTPMDPLEDGNPDATKCEVPGHPRVRVLGNTVDESGKPTALLAKAGYEWHQDTGGKGSSAGYSLLYCLESPDSGAETLFAKCSTAWERLTPKQKEFIENVDAVYSNQSTAGGPAAFDAAFGLRMNAAGTRRIRAAHRKRAGWKLNEKNKEICGLDRQGKKAFWPGAKNFEYFVVNGEKIDPYKSQCMLEELMNQAVGLIKSGEVDENCETITKTEFDPEVVMPISWSKGYAVIWDNSMWLHSTTPTNIYSPGKRVMLQVIYTPGSSISSYTDLSGDTDIAA